MKAFVNVIAIVLCGVAISACSALNSNDSNVYKERNVHKPQQVSYGQVVSTREVFIKSSGNVGTIAGGVIGGVLGNQVGGGRGKILGAIAGTFAGAVVGKSVEESIASESAQEIVVRTNRGRNFAVIQGFDQIFLPGDAVIITENRGSVRISLY